MRSRLTKNGTDHHTCRVYEEALQSRRMIEKSKTEMKGNERKSQILNIFVCMLCLFLIVFSFIYSCRTRYFDSFQKYQSAGLFVEYITPKEPSEFMGVSRHLCFLGGIDIYSFNVSKEEYTEIEKRLIKDFNLKSKDPDAVKYGNARYYGIKVGEINQQSLDYSLDDFTESDLFKYVSDVSVTDYRVIYFRPTGTGNIEQGVFADPGTGRIICYRKKGM